MLRLDVFRSALSRLASPPGSVFLFWSVLLACGFIELPVTVAFFFRCKHPKFDIFLLPSPSKRGEGMR